ncbi:MAG: helix-turn-helix domain-containing protein [Gemmatimonadota bacterium]
MTTAAELLRQARASAGLSQRALAKRAGTAQSAIARIERGQTSPTWSTLERLLKAANYEVVAQAEPSVVVGSHMLAEVPGILRMTPEDRLAEIKNVEQFLQSAHRVSENGVPYGPGAGGGAGGGGGGVPPLDPKLLFTTLGRHDVQFVLIGALAAKLQGFPRFTRDADITPARQPDNLKRLAAALRELNARIYTEPIPEGLAFDCTAQMLARGDIWNLVTNAGRLDLAFEPSGTRGYDDLASTAVRFELYGHNVLIASLEDVIRSKTAANRPQDRQDVVVMQEMLKRR